jgi:hypothetical protein
MHRRIAKHAHLDGEADDRAQPPPGAAATWVELQAESDRLPSRLRKNHAARQLARDGGGTETHVHRFGASSRRVVDFLMDEVIAAHDPETQDFMFRSSILEQFSGPLCDAVLDTQGSAEQLEALSRTNLFLVPLDDERERYRFHRLFGQLLRMELAHREPELAPTLHRRASAWHREHGTTEAACSNQRHRRACPVPAETSPGWSVWRSNRVMFAGAAVSTSTPGEWQMTSTSRQGLSSLPLQRALSSLPAPSSCGKVMP